MGVLTPRLHKEEFARAGDEIYDRDIREKNHVIDNNSVRTYRG